MTTDLEAAETQPRSYSKAQESRRERVIDVAYDLLLTTPYERIQMKEISEESGVALATVYRYFSSKEFLFVLVLSRWIHRFGTRVQNRPLRGKSNEERLVDAFARAVRAFQRMPQFFEAFQLVERSTDPQARAALDELSAAINGTYAAALTGLDQPTVDAIIWACNATMNSLLRCWARGTMQLDAVDAQMARTISLLTSGARPN